MFRISHDGVTSMKAIVAPPASGDTFKFFCLTLCVAFGVDNRWYGAAEKPRYCDIRFHVTSTSSIVYRNIGNITVPLPEPLRSAVNINYNVPKTFLSGYPGKKCIKQYECVRNFVTITVMYTCSRRLCKPKNSRAIADVWSRFMIEVVSIVNCYFRSTVTDDMRLRLKKMYSVLQKSFRGHYLVACHFSGELSSTKTKARK